MKKISYKLITFICIICFLTCSTVQTSAAGQTKTTTGNATKTESSTKSSKGDSKKTSSKDDTKKTGEEIELYQKYEPLISMLEDGDYEGAHSYINKLNNKESNDDVVTELTGPYKFTDISEIEWKVKEKIVDGKRYAIFGYKNNSDVRIISVEVEFRQPEGTDLEAVKKAYADFIKVHECTDEDVADLWVYGYSRKLADPDETVEGAVCTVNGSFFYMDNMREYEVTEPDIMTIAYFDVDNKVHQAYYDFKNEEFSYDDRIIEVFSWPENEFAEALPIAEDTPLVMVSSDDEKHTYIDCYGVEQDMYESYKEKCLADGYSKIESDESTNYGNRFEAVNTKLKQSLRLYYDSTDEHMSIQLDPVIE